MLDIKRVGKLMLAGLMTLTITGCSNGSAASDSMMDSIKESKTLKIGISQDILGFGVENTATGEFEGIEADLSELIADDLAKKLDIDDVEVKYTKVNSKTRTTMLDEGSVDAVICAFTITPERAESWNFSSYYFNDAVSVLVKDGVFAKGVESFPDVAKQRGSTIKIGVGLGSTSAQALREYIEEKFGYTKEEQKEFLDIQDFNSADEIMIALNSGAVDGYSVDYSVLHSYQEQNEGLVILSDTNGDSFSPQPLGIATRYKTNEDLEFTKFMQDEMRKFWEDGTINKILEDNGFKAQEAPIDLDKEYGPYHHGEE